LSLEKIAKVNSTNKTEPFFELSQEDVESSIKNSINEAPKENSTNYTLLDLFYYGSLRKASFGFILISFTLHLIYYGG
jgi:hypothetical protein